MLQRLTDRGYKAIPYVQGIYQWMLNWMAATNQEVSHLSGGFYIKRTKLLFAHNQLLRS